VAPGSIYGVLHRECFTLFPDEMFADLFTDVGRQRSGWISRVSSAWSIRLREDDDAPGCLPGLRPDLLRDERFFAGLLRPRRIR
jgi:hypothetical protein